MPENIIEVIGHQGPHPEQLHKLVFDRLTAETKGLIANTPEYKAAVTNTLNEIGKDAQTKGTLVNKLITKQ